MDESRQMGRGSLLSGWSWNLPETSPGHLSLSIRPGMSNRSWNIQVESRTVREKTLIKIPEANSPPCNHLYMDPSSQRSRGWNFVSCKEVLLVSWWNIIVLGDLSFSWGEEGLSCWEDDAGSDQWVVILSSNLYINKAIQVFLHILVCLIVYAFV